MNLEGSEGNTASRSRPDLDTALARVVVADYVHVRLCELDYASLLQPLDGLDDLWGNRTRRQPHSESSFSKTC